MHLDFLGMYVFYYPELLKVCTTMVIAFRIKGDSNNEIIIALFTAFKIISIKINVC